MATYLENMSGISTTLQSDALLHGKGLKQKWDTDLCSWTACASGIACAMST